MRIRTLAFTAIIGTIYPHVASAAASGPLEARLTNCEPQWDLPSNGQTPGYGGPGFHNVAADRRFRAQLAYNTQAAADSIADALDLVERIYLCRVRPVGARSYDVHCPVDWVLWDRSSGTDIVPRNVVSSGGPGDPEWDGALQLELDWQDGSLSNAAVVLRVQHVGDPAPANDIDSIIQDAQRFGACSNWSRRSALPTGSRFVVYGSNPITLQNPNTPAAPTEDLCVPRFTWGHSASPTVCITNERAEFVRLWMERAQVAHEERLQRALPLTEREFSWRNGSDGQGGYNPHYVLLGPHVGGFGQSTGGGIQVNPHDFRFLDPYDAAGNLKVPVDALPGLARNSVQLTMHEFIHSLQQAWGREEPATVPLQRDVGYIAESFTKSGEMNLCLQDFPGAVSADDRRCMNPGKLGLIDGGRYGGRSLQGHPTEDLLTTPYKSAFFLGYVYEQFGYPVGRTPHPTGTPSTIARPGNDNPPTTLDLRDSDEGMDFLGWLLQEYAVTPSGVNPFDAMDPALQTHLGRSFADVLLDFHTTLYLKDYTDTDPRWRFEWMDANGYGAGNPSGPPRDSISDAKPFEVPSDLYGRTCGVSATTANTRCDNLNRTHRTLDSWRTGAGTAVRDLLAVGDVRTSGSVVTVGAYGTTAVSVSPDPGWAGSDMKVTLARQRARPLRFRLFRVQQDTAAGTLTPEPLCDPECSLVADDTNGRDVFNQLVPIDANTVEVLAIASAGSQGGHFEYAFGASAAHVSILSPTGAAPALIGHPTVGRQSFVVALSIRDEDGATIDLAEANKEDLVLEATGCADATSCVLPEDTYTIVPVTGGTVLAVVTLPASFYPATGAGTFDLVATLKQGNDPTATASQALAFDVAGHASATALVLDHSGSMNDQGGAKLAALKAVAKGIVSSLVPVDAGATPNQLALISFRIDATTDFPFAAITADNDEDVYAIINGLTAEGWTALGDGLYEAQYELGRAFDGVAAAPARQSMVILSDGISNRPAEPHLYFDRGDTAAPTSDGNSDWSAVSPLYYPDRVAGGLPVPIISAVGFGQDADLVTLDQLTRLNGQTPLYVPDTASGEALSDYGITAALADGLGDTVTRSIGFERVAAMVVQGATDEDDEVIYSTAASSDGNVAHFDVEPGARELRVVVTSKDSAGSSGTLRDPSGASVTATAISDDGRGRSFRVADPPAGPWTFSSSAYRRSEPHVLVDASVRGTQRLHVFTDADLLSAKGDVAAGARVSIRAVPVEGRAITQCSSVRATVTRPHEGTGVTLDLLDDGQHGDGSAGDGVYGAAYSRTGTPGAYRVNVTSTCTSPVTGAQVRRERAGGFVVFVAPSDDPDGDGMPSWWESDCLNPNDPGDLLGDPDGDGLINGVEFQYGTSPCLSDTDGGGESDASEANLRSNPLDPSDDRVSTPIPELTPGDTRVYIVPGMATAGGVLRAQWAPTEQGAWSDVPGTWTEGYVLHAGLTNGQRICYRLMFTTSGGVATAWSEARCTVPNADPTAPQVDILDGLHACGAEYVQPTLRYADMPFTSDFSMPKVDMGVRTSGVTEMRIWAGVGEPPATAAWQLATESPLIALASGVTTYSVQVRDKAGNVSAPVTLPVICPQPPCAYEPQAIGCCVSAETCTGMTDYALYGEGTLRIADSTQVTEPSGGFARVANAGSGETNLGVETTTGSLWAAGSVVLRDRGKVEGDVFAAGSIQILNGASITGTHSAQRSDLRLLPLATFTVPFPATAGPNIWLEPDRSRTVAPGNYGQLHVASRSKVTLQAGAYFFTGVNLEPQAEVRFDTSAGPVWLYVKDNFTYKGAFVDMRGRHDRVMVGYFGTSTAFIETPFSGTIVAPRARVELKTVTGAHRGSFYAKELEVHSRTRVEHYPFVAPWRAGLIAGDAWHASEEPQVVTGGCGCVVAGSGPDASHYGWFGLVGLGLLGFGARRGGRRERA